MLWSFETPVNTQHSALVVLTGGDPPTQTQCKAAAFPSIVQRFASLWDFSLSLFRSFFFQLFAVTPIHNVVAISNNIKRWEHLMVTTPETERTALHDTLASALLLSAGAL
jgi:hypothetical protein